MKEVTFPPQGTARERIQTQMSAGDHLPPENSDDFLMQSRPPARTILLHEAGQDGERRWG